MKIPPEALKAARIAYTARIYKGTGSMEEFASAIEDACLAMLKEWPGMKEEWRDGFKFDPLPHGTAFRYSILILPLPTEARDGRTLVDTISDEVWNHDASGDNCRATDPEARDE